jgi:hypothetical protein
VSLLRPWLLGLRLGCTRVWGGCMLLHLSVYIYLSTHLYVHILTALEPCAQEISYWLLGLWLEDMRVRGGACSCTACEGNWDPQALHRATE